MNLLADVFEPGIAHQRAGQQAGLGQNLEAVADAQHQAAAGGKPLAPPASPAKNAQWRRCAGNRRRQTRREPEPHPLPARSSESCQRKVTGWWATSAITWNVSWSQLEPGKTRTPNFMLLGYQFRGCKATIDVAVSQAKRLASSTAASTARNSPAAPYVPAITGDTLKDNSLQTLPACSGFPIAVDRNHCRQVAFFLRRSHPAQCQKDHTNWKNAVESRCAGEYFPAGDSPQRRWGSRHQRFLCTARPGPSMHDCVLQ